MDFDAETRANNDGENDVQRLTAENLEADGIQHGFFLRTGGVSEGIYASLNCGRGSNDSRSRVEENRSRAASAIGASPDMLIGPRQVHSAVAVIAEAAWTPGTAPEADAIVSNVRGIALSVLTADCAPILMADAKAGVIAAVHAGWKGAKAGVLESAIKEMLRLGARPENISAAIGPTISQDSYEVSPKFQAAFVLDGERNLKYFSQQPGARPHFNLPAFVKDKLLQSGVTNILDTGMCTYKNESILFSYRRTCHRSEPDYGRQISAILLV
jgi:YfiH family protein